MVDSGLTRAGTRSSACIVTVCGTFVREANYVNDGVGVEWGAMSAVQCDREVESPKKCQ